MTQAYSLLMLIVLLTGSFLSMVTRADGNEARELELRVETLDRLTKQKFAACSIDEETSEARAAMESAESAFRTELLQALDLEHVEDAEVYVQALRASDLDALYKQRVPEFLQILGVGGVATIRVESAEEKMRLQREEEQTLSEGLLNQMIIDVAETLKGTEAEQRAAEVLPTRFNALVECAKSASEESDLEEVCPVTEEMQREIAAVVSGYRSAFVREWVRRVRAFYGVSSQEAPASVTPIEANDVYAFWNYAGREIKISVPARGTERPFARTLTLRLDDGAEYVGQDVMVERPVITVRETLEHPERGAVALFEKVYPLFIGEYLVEGDDGSELNLQGIPAELVRLARVDLRQFETDRWFGVEYYSSNMSETSNAYMGVLATRHRLLERSQKALHEHCGVDVLPVDASAAVVTASAESDSASAEAEEEGTVVKPVPAFETVERAAFSEEFQRALRETEAAFSQTLRSK